tara:strand:+ start:36 stop:197 length:162 start_codon:yes stop_codon:yes gene_type:complete
MVFIRNSKAPVRNGRYACCNKKATWQQLRNMNNFHIASNVIVCLTCGDRKVIE